MMRSRDRLIAAYRNRSVDRPPVWLMRQAGRYLPEYQAIRRKHSFWDMMRTPELAVEVSLQPVRRFGMDAAILFSDILVVLDAMGLEVEYGHAGPVIRALVRDRRDLERLVPVEAENKLSYLQTSVDGLCRQLHPEAAVIGFAGAPFTLAAYLVEQGPDRSAHRLKALATDQPHVYRELLDRLVDAVAELLVLQIRAGVDAVQIFDTWAGRLSLRDYQELALPYVKMVIQRLDGLEVPIVLYVRNSALNLKAAASSGCTVLAVDESLSIQEARRQLGPGIGLQGNFDPDHLCESRDKIRCRVHEMIATAGRTGYIVNLGRGLVPQSPVEGVQALVQAVKEWSA